MISRGRDTVVPHVWLCRRRDPSDPAALLADNLYHEQIATKLIAQPQGGTTS